MNHENDINELIKYRINRANETIGEVENLIKLGYFNTSINRIYYACYYAVIALILKKGLSAKSHDGVRQIFGLHYVKTGLISKEHAKYFTDLFDRRQTGDYDDFVVYKKETVEELFKPAKDFINTIEELIKSNK
ncbi:MAG: antitoxin [Bacteroidetes bacterium CG02_land_8_20_14_3_00_31_25]|nr:HEPN domain-containing protein [Bacteroidota bacterium]PIV61597.1 MAG: antitoxin [Bacteroidetes bacterium CG02_land_8_20_14_3_00_31_25]PIX33107.1 MAG: antitoxin [Bacteroidetes bacterium CG_4_8_14_3_um_filter_31_14]PIY03716.1 MAG: antitoxin [Bacteroidetes bacterium CG_4_10_14_3_um_filter_31_20]